MFSGRCFIIRHYGTFVVFLFVFCIRFATSPAPTTVQNSTVGLKNINTGQNGIDVGKVSKIVSKSDTSKKNARVPKPSRITMDKSNPDILEDIILLDPDFQDIPEHKLSKEAAEMLRWLSVDPDPSNPLPRLKRFKKYFLTTPTSNNVSIETWRDNDTGQPRNIQDQHISAKSRWLNTSSSNPLRSKRQAEPGELPRWPGMPEGDPQGQAKGQRQGHEETQQEKTSFVKKKILGMMMQSLYSAQERLWPLGPLVKKYDHLTPYRMAFIFLKLDQLVHEGHSIKMYLERQSQPGQAPMSLTRRLQMYSQLMRRHVDVTYLVDYIMQRVPRDQQVRIRQWLIRAEQERLLSSSIAVGRTTTKLLARPPY